MLCFSRPGDGYSWQLDLGFPVMGRPFVADKGRCHLLDFLEGHIKDVEKSRDNHYFLVKLNASDGKSLYCYCRIFD